MSDNFYFIKNRNTNDLNKNSLNKILEYLKRHNKTIDDTFKLMIIDLLTETNLDYYIFKKILKGAYVIINDNGYFYNKWIKFHKNNLNKLNKIVEPSFFYFFNGSSHYSCNSQYRLGNGIIYDTDGQLTNTYDLLISTSCLHKNYICKNKKKCDTWFQLERSRISTLSNFLGHTFDYLNYIIYGNNIGPFGESEHTETNNPIILKLKKEFL